MSTRPTLNIKRLVLCGAILVIVLILVAVAMLLHRPAWFDSRLTPPSDSQKRGSELESAILRELTRVRPDKTGGRVNANPDEARERTSEHTLAGNSYVSEVWAVSIMESDINAWLSARLPAWLQSREISMPDAISSMRIMLEENQAFIAAEYAGPPSVILTQPITFTITPSRDLAIELSSISSGAMPLPGLTLTTLLPKDLLGSLIGKAPNNGPDSSQNHITIPNARLGLEDGRAVRILDIKILSGRLELTCQTEK